ncbi:hypothetical protein FN846DRAFT_896096 [Sphaerosporella brunnea]|uniref:Uncharacterized protein n=1 Tax=Sphaerosporella brunnea TaxID=1250544 RepID=A0A5J5EE13_9PEZI|nr:hypothetical protein FN846DRAFT_896096 [Sphaerosporella brunnea]
MYGTPRRRRRGASIEISKLNKQYQDKETRLNNEWKNPGEWKELLGRELQARAVRAAAIAKGEKPPKTTQAWRGKKHQIVKIKRGKGVGLIPGDTFSTSAVKACGPWLPSNPDFILMENGAASHGSGYTNQERVKEAGLATQFS